MPALTVKDTMTLDLEAGRWKYAGAKEAHVRELFGESMTRYYQRLSALLRRPEALAHAPVVVNRLRRVQEARTAAREGR